MEKMLKGVSPLRLFSRASPNKTGQDAATPNVPASGTGGRAPLSSIPEAAFNPVIGDANSGDFSSPPRKADSSTPRERKKSSALVQGGSYPHLENLDVSGTPPTAGLSKGTSKSQFTWHQRKQSSNVLETPSNAQGPGSATAQPVPLKTVSRALKYNVHQPSTASSGAAAGGRPPSSTVLNVRTPNVSKYGPSPSSACSNTDQQFDLEEDPTFWRDHNVQVLIRTRPLNSSEMAAQGSARCLRQESAHMITWTGQPESRFTFDHVACESITQEKLFRVAGLPMVDNCIAGYNSCMFAYGQTGSGKTHTMLGDIENLDNRPSNNRGMTPRVFEYLFARIRHEEEARRNERLKYLCKCSFLEIYNEQITDLLEPTSNNLQMREDAKKGVYVENLTEVEVLGVQDVIQLLLQGAANRKVAATNMNRESSRSHSVFTCVVESKWEYDSMMNTRYGRLNLVDLAGSERQKNSGAEGERLKEAANINKSLSTLGLVIMVLVDIANGKQRHVPYRDSKLTFLLQDSLGGNSKTTIIANVGPSICCSMETLSTLKFAQRAKFIRNNAVVNEDATADVPALRGEIQQLKDELSRLRRQGTSRSASHRSSIPLRETSSGNENSLAIVGFSNSGDVLRRSVDSSWDSTRHRPVSTEMAKRVESLLAGSMRREQETESTSKRLAAEIEQLNRLVRQREEDTQCTKMMLRFREDKIRRLEAVADGILSAEECLMEEKASLQEELQLLRARMDRNPELTRFAMENIRLMEEVRRYQEFYEGMERETLMDEIGCLRDQLIEAFEGKALNANSLTPATPQDSQPTTDAAALRNAEEIMQLQLQLQSYEAVVEEKDCQRQELEVKCSELHKEICQLTEKLERASREKCLGQSVIPCKLEETVIAPCSIGHSSIAGRSDSAQASMSQASVLSKSRSLDIAASMRHAEEIMHLQLQLESYEAMLDEGQALRNGLETKCSNLTAQVDDLTVKLENVEEKLLLRRSVDAPALQTGLEDTEKTRLPGLEAFQSRGEPSSVEIVQVCNPEPSRMDVHHTPINSESSQTELTSSMSGSGSGCDGVIQLQLRVECYEAVLTEELLHRKMLEGRCTELNEQVGKLTEQLNTQLERERQMDITRCQAETETARTIKLLHTELMELKKGTRSADDSPGAEKLRELLIELESRALYEAAVDVDDIIDETFSLRLSLDPNIPRSQAVSRSKSLELIQRKLQTARTLAQETEAQFQELSSFVVEISNSHEQEKDGLMEEIRLSQKRRQELEAETAALASDLEDLRTALTAHEESVRGVEKKWKQEKDQLLLELHEARLTAKEKGSESATLLQKFEDGQSILLELEQTMNALVRANATKTDSEREWKREKDGLVRDLGEVKLLAEEKGSEAAALLRRLDESHKVRDSEAARLRAELQDEQDSLRVQFEEKERMVMLQCDELVQLKAETRELLVGKLALEVELKDKEQTCGALNKEFLKVNSELMETLVKKTELEDLLKDKERSLCALNAELLDARSLEHTRTQCEKQWGEERGALLSNLHEAKVITDEKMSEAAVLRKNLGEVESALSEKEKHVDLLSQDLLQLNAELQDLRLQNKSMQDELQEKHQWVVERGKLLADLHEAKVVGEEHMTESARFQKILGVLQFSVAEKESHVNTLSNDLLQLNTEVQELRLENDSFRDQLQEKFEWGIERDRLLLDLHQANVLGEEHVSEAANLRMNLGLLESALSEKEKLVDSLSHDLIRLNGEVQELRQETKSMSEQLGEKHQWEIEKDKLLSEFHEAKTSGAESASEARSLRITLGELQMVLVDKNQSCGDLDIEVLQLKAELRELLVEKTALEDLLKDKEQTFCALNAELLNARSLDNNRNQFEKEWRHERDGLLSELQAAKLIADNKILEAGILCKTLKEVEFALSEKENHVASLSQDLLEMNAELQELRRHNKSLQNLLEEKDQWGIERDGLLSDLHEAKVSGEEHVSEAATLRMTLGHVESALSEKENHLESLSHDLLKLNAEVQELRQENRSIQCELEHKQDWGEERNILLTNLHEANVLGEAHLSETAVLRKTLEQLQCALSGKENDVDKLSHDLVQLNAEVHELRLESKSFQDQLEEKYQLGIERDRLLLDLHGANVLGEEHVFEAASLRKTLGLLESSLSEKDKLVGSLSHDLLRLNSEVLELRQENRSLSEQLGEKHEWGIEKDKLLLELDEARCSGEKNVSKGLLETLGKLELVLSEKEKLINSLSDELLQLTAEQQDLRMQNKSAQEKLEEQQQHVTDLKMELMNALTTRSESEKAWAVEKEAIHFDLHDAKLSAQENQYAAEGLTRTLRELEAALSEKESFGDSLSEDMLQLNAQLKELRVEAKSSQDELQEKQQILASLEVELQEATLLEQARSDSEHNWRREQDELLGDLHEANLRVSEIETECANLNKNLREIQAAAYGKEKLLNALSEELLHSEAKIQGLNSRVESLQDQVKEKEQVIVGMHEAVLDTRTLERTRVESEKAWEKEREELICRIEKASQTAKEKESEAAALRKNYDESLALLRDLQSRMNDLVSTNEKLMSDAQSLHVERERVRLAYEKYAVLEAKLQRTEEVKLGLEFDISLLQESAAELTFKREEAGRLRAAVDNLEQQLEIGCQELRETKLSMSKLETTLYEKENMLNSLSDELLEAKAEVEGRHRAIVSVEDEREETQQSIADLAIVLHATSKEQDITRSKKLTHAIKERNRLQEELVVLTEQLDMAHSIAEEQESLASEARQAALASKVLADNKEAEARLLERSVEELESTVNALESQVGIVKREGERQRLLREDLEMELQSLRHQMSSVRDNAEEKDMLVLPARKAGTVVVSTNKSVEKPKTKTSGSPFKCGSKGLVQQLHSDIDDEIYANRQRIEELEGIATARQKEVFMLHTRLAEAESMTHDVIRDLLGVKLDITKCAYLLSQENVQEIAEAARKRTDEAKEKDAELSSVRAQLSEFIEERESWLEEINRRQAEMVAARIAAEKLRLRDQTLTAENERLQRDTSSQRKRLLDLEGEVKKLSGQQNLQQRIHHHAKIKEENNQLRTQNEDLSNRLRRTEIVLARVSDELARYRTAEGKTPFLNIDEEQHLKNRLKDEEDNRTRVAQKLISLCTSVMKAAGVGYLSSEMDSDVAVRALHQMEERLQVAERELSDMRLHSRIAGEKRRLSELRAVHSPYRTNFTAGVQVSSPRGDR